MKRKTFKNLSSGRQPRVEKLLVASNKFRGCDRLSAFLLYLVQDQKPVQRCHSHQWWVHTYLNNRSRQRKGICRHGMGL